MKHFIYVVFLLLSLTVSAQKFDTPVEYLEFISKEQQRVTKNMWRYTQAIAHSRNDNNIKRRHQEVVKTLDQAIGKIAKVEPYNNDNAYKEKVLENLQLNKDLLTDNYAAIIDMKAVSEQSYDALEAYILAQEMADAKMEQAQADYESNFYAFADKYKVTITEGEDDLSKKMRISGEVFDYYNDMHLVFFKVYFNEITLMEAMEKNDVNAIQQNANALNAAAKEGLRVLDTVAEYKMDKNLIKRTREAFEFFVDESENQIPQIVNFMVMNSDFERITQALEKTPARKRTKEQIDSYNKKVKEINKAVAGYNKTNETLNRNRALVINNINKENGDFLDRHIPAD